MNAYHIKGRNVLSGRVEISGAKNAALPLLAAAIVTRGDNEFLSCPEISDVDSMVKILRALGCEISNDGNRLSINADNMSSFEIPRPLMKEMRSSMFLAGSLLARCGEAIISNPGGCNIGERPIDIHISGLKQLGASIVFTEDTIIIKSKNLVGTDIMLKYPSVGATENLMMAALAAKGTTRIFNSAKEPEIEDLQKYINSCGGKISGAGTDVITIEGRRILRGCKHQIIPDRIEAGTYLLMALATGGRIELANTDPKTIRPLLDILRGGGYYVREKEHMIIAKDEGVSRIKCDVSTAPYPGFPTDLQPQMTAFLTCCGKGSIIEENIFEKRHEYTKELKKMGADIEISEKKVIIINNNILCGTRVKAEDLRGGVALVIAGLMATGTTIVDNTKYIKRGYSGLVEKITALGGEIIEYES